MSAALDVEAIRRDFPILKTKMNGKPLVYLDSAATSQKPIQVIEAISEYYRTYNANIHRGLYKISEKATEQYVESKEKLAAHIGAQRSSEIIYVRNATEAINLVSKAWGRGTSRGETTYLFLRWSTTQTWCRGRSSLRGRALFSIT